MRGNGEYIKRFLFLGSVVEYNEVWGFLVVLVKFFFINRTFGLWCLFYNFYFCIFLVLYNIFKEQEKSCENGRGLRMDRGVFMSQEEY